MNPRVVINLAMAFTMPLAIGMAGCASRMVDIRPYAAHPDQKIEADDHFVSEQHRIRTTVRYMRQPELDAVFRAPGQNVGTDNPFLYRPPHAPVKFTVFRIKIRNNSEYDAFGEFDKFMIRDDLGNEYRPIVQENMMNYWLGQVKMRLGAPITWVPQMRALERKKAKEKSVVETLYKGGRIPPRGEHTGYIVFRDIPEDGKPRLKWYERGWFRTLEFAAPIPIGFSLTRDRNVMLSSAIGLTLGALTLYAADLFWGPPKAIKIGHLQLIIEVTTRPSRYGSPLNLALSEINFDVVKIIPPHKNDPEMDQWRPLPDTTRPGRQ